MLKKLLSISIFNKKENIINNNEIKEHTVNEIKEHTVFISFTVGALRAYSVVASINNKIVYQYQCNTINPKRSTVDKKIIFTATYKEVFEHVLYICNIFKASNSLNILQNNY